MALRCSRHPVVILQWAAQLRSLPESAGSEFGRGFLFSEALLTDIIELSRALATGTDPRALIQRITVT